ncbi:uncharacterized protein [Gossypium hirsutum]|uniref:Retrotransposon gag domain-containing protein n=1 Tax=Gossypium hirsutum TaxID=3635 RepID=A0ABM3BLI0_GOSHI|nr:uncharacterized protein LOC107943992 [Gossypium hirsutum]
MAERQPVRNVPDLNMQAMLREFERLFDQKLEPIQDHLDQVEMRGRRGRTPLSPPRNRNRRQFQDNKVSEPSGAESDQGSNVSERRRGRRHHGSREQERYDDDLKSIKLTIPHFHGRSDPEAYLEWEKKIELVFECHNYSEAKKVKLAAIEFSDYAMIWWDQFVTSRRRNGERPITTWTEMKAVMRRRFIPSYYHRELYQKLQNLTQGTKSVEDYYKEMEIAMIRADVQEDREATMARFLAGLNREIANIVELQHYVEIVDMVHMAIKVEKQIKKKGSARGYSYSNTSKWNQGSSKSASTNPIKEPTTPPKTLKPIAESSKGEMLVVKRNLSVQTSVDKLQRENLFHTRGLVKERVCSIVIDGGSCTNVASTYMVDKLALPTIKHPSPYKLQWLNEGVELKVTKQAKISFSIGNYHDEVLCDVVPMHAGHILLGRPWQFDRRVKHDGFANQYSFQHKGKNVTLVPLSPQQVMED